MIDSVKATASETVELLCYVTPDDSHNYPPEKFPEVTSVIGERLTMSDLWNGLIPYAKGDIFMLCADDVIFRTPKWDDEVEAAFDAVPDKILLAFGDDGGPTGKTFSTLPFVHRKWVEAVGYFTGPGFSADYSDTWPFDVATMIDRVKFLPIVTEHMHWVHGKAPKDQTYEENAERYRRDRPDLQYVARLAERQADAEKLRKVMQT